MEYYVSQLIGYWKKRHHWRNPRLILIDNQTGEIRMPLTIAVGSKGATAVLTEFDAAGNVVPSAGIVSYASSNPAVATVANNQLTAVGPGTSTITGTDSGDNITASDVLTVTDPAVSGKLTLTAN
jgi:hypothetical protein